MSAIVIKVLERMDVILATAAIVCILALWILAVYGYGFMLLSYLQRRFPSLQVLRSTDSTNSTESSHALVLLLVPIIGMFALCFGVAIWHIFLPLYSLVSIVVLLVGVWLFFHLYKQFLQLDSATLLSAGLALLMLAPLSAFSDSVGDSVNYHIQIVTWIQESPLVFGLGNVHTRLGYNGLIYNFYALTDVAQIIPRDIAHLRSFIGNEIMYFGLLFSAFLIIARILARQYTPKFYEIFLIMALFPFLFVMKWPEFRGLYCEGIGVVLGMAIFSLLLFVLSRETKCAEHEKHANLAESSQLATRAIFALGFFLALFSTMVKIANFALIIAVVLCYLFVYRKAAFSKSSLKFYAYIGLAAALFTLPWVLTGLATSGMIAYPASIGYITSLPWAVSEQMRDNEVCWIMSWARAPMLNCREVLSSHAWMVDWFSMKTRYFGYFRYFVYTFFLALAVAAMARVLTKHAKGRENVGSSFGLVFGCVLIGVVYWFIAGPDPRFGMVYIVPAIALLLAYILHSALLIARGELESSSFRESSALDSSSTACAKPHTMIFFVGFVLCLVPMFLNGRHALIIIWAVLLGLILWGRISHRRGLLLWLFGLSGVLGTANFYRHDFYAIAEYPKIRAVHLEERRTDSGLLVYVRSDNPTQQSKEVSYEARPMTPYFNPKLQKGEFLGREMYFIPQEPQNKSQDKKESK